MGSCCYGCLKYMVVICNLLYMLLGLALLGTSLWMHLDNNYFSPVTDDMEGYNFVLFFLMGVGVVMSFMGFLGCIGALQESQGMLATFFAMVVVLFAGQIAAAGWLYMNYEKFEKILENSIAASIQKDYGEPNMSLKTASFDILQKEMKCCGSSGPTDWKKSRFNGYNPDDSIDIGVVGNKLKNSLGIYKIPDSCCKSHLPQQACDVAKRIGEHANGFSSSIYTEGCSKKILTAFKSHELVILGVILSILLVEVLAMIFSMVLCCTVRRMDQYKA